MIDNQQHTATSATSTQESAIPEQQAHQSLGTPRSVNYQQVQPTGEEAQNSRASRQLNESVERDDEQESWRDSTLTSNDSNLLSRNAGAHDADNLSDDHSVIQRGSLPLVNNAYSSAGQTGYEVDPESSLDDETSYGESLFSDYIDNPIFDLYEQCIE